MAFGFLSRSLVHLSMYHLHMPKIMTHATMLPATLGMTVVGIIEFLRSLVCSVLRHVFPMVCESRIATHSLKMHVGGKGPVIRISRGAYVDGHAYRRCHQLFPCTHDVG